MGSEFLRSRFDIVIPSFFAESYLIIFGDYANSIFPVVFEDSIFIGVLVGRPIVSGIVLTGFIISLIS